MWTSALKAPLVAWALAVAPALAQAQFPARPVTIVVPFAAGGPTDTIGRIAAAPDVPTVDEAGLPGFYMAVWHGLWAPKGTPKAVIARLNAAAVEALSDPQVVQRLVDLGQVIPAREEQTPEALGALHRAEIEKWWPVNRAAGIKAD